MICDFLIYDPTERKWLTPEGVWSAVRSDALQFETWHDAELIRKELKQNRGFYVTRGRLAVTSGGQS